MSKRISVQWRITILTALLIAAACVSLNLLLFYSGSGSMDALNGFVVEYKTENQQAMTIEIPKENMQAFFSDFSQQVNEEKVRFERMGWCITALVTLLSAIIAYFFSGKALKPLKDFAQQTGQINEESLTDTRLPEDTTAEFRQLSESVNGMLDRLAQAFDAQRQFTGNAAHELRTPLALMQTRLELFAAEHRQMSEETAKLLHFQQEQVERLSALVRTLLEMSDLQSVPRTDCIDLAPMAEEVLVDLTPLAQKKRHHAHADRRQCAAHRQRCAAVSGAVQPDRERHQVQPHGRLCGAVGRAGARAGGHPCARYRPGHRRGIPRQHLSAVFPRG